MLGDLVGRVQLDVERLAQESEPDAQDKACYSGQGTIAERLGARRAAGCLCRLADCESAGDQGPIDLELATLVGERLALRATRCGLADLLFHKADCIVERLLLVLLAPLDELFSEGIGQLRRLFGIRALRADYDDVGVRVDFCGGVGEESGGTVAPAELSADSLGDLRSDDETGESRKLALIRLGQIDVAADDDAERRRLRYRHDARLRRVCRRLEKADGEDDRCHHEGRLDDNPSASPEDLKVPAYACCFYAVGHGPHPHRAEHGVASRIICQEDARALRT